MTRRTHTGREARTNASLAFTHRRTTPDGRSRHPRLGHHDADYPARLGLVKALAALDPVTRGFGLDEAHQSSRAPALTRWPGDQMLGSDIGLVAFRHGRSVKESITNT